MAKTSKKKTYTEDVVLNKIFKEISEENLGISSSTSQEHNKQNIYEDDLIKRYREKDASQLRQKYIHIAKIVAFLLILTIVIFIFTNYLGSISDKEIPIKKTLTHTPLPQVEVEQVSKPVQIQTVKIEPKEIISVKTEPKKIIPTPIEKPVKKVKTERELAKDMLLRQMNN